MHKKTAEPKAPAADKKDKKGGGKGKEVEPEETIEGKEPAAKKDKDSKKKWSPSWNRWNRVWIPPGVCFQSAEDEQIYFVLLNIICII